MPEHRDLTEIHRPDNWQPADSTARAALAVTAQDIGKWARQADSGNYYRLDAVSPSVVWTQVAGPGGGGGGGGTVTSVALTAAAIFAVTGSPITSSGTLNLALASQSGNLVLASPNGSSGVPSFRSLVVADISGLGSLASLSSINNGNWSGTALAIANGGTGQTSANAALNAFLPGQTGNAGKALFTDGTNASWGAVSGSGTVTSVGLSLPAELTVSGSPVTASGTLSAAWASQTANKFLASPNGSTGTPSFRVLVSADLPSHTHAASDITSGQIALARGGTGADLTATGGTSQVLRQSTVGGAVTVSQLAASDISGLGGLATLSSINNGNWSGTQLSIANGGTGQTTANAALNALLPSQATNSGKFLTTDGTNTSWATASGGLSAIANNTVLGNNSGSSAVPTALTCSQVLDMISTTQGTILYRAAGGSGWLGLAPGTSGQFLQTQGAGNNPQWATVTASAIFVQTADGTCSNTTAETTITSTGTGSLTLAANSMTVGANYRIIARGYCKASSDTLTIKVKLGSTIVATTGAVFLNTGSVNMGWKLEIDVSVRSTGASGTVYAFGYNNRTNGTGAVSACAMTGSTINSTTTIDTTVSQAISVTAQWVTASVNNAIVCTNCVVEKM